MSKLFQVKLREMESFIARETRDRTGKAPDLVRITIEGETLRIDVEGLLTKIEKHCIDSLGNRAIRDISGLRRRTFEANSNYWIDSLSKIFDTRLGFEFDDWDLKNDKLSIQMRIFD